MSKEELLHDIRNKMQGAQNLISLVEKLKDCDKQDDWEKTFSLVMECVPNAKASMNYLRTLKL